MVRLAEWGLGALAACGLFYLALPVLVRPFWRIVMGTRYRIRVVGQEHIPRTGPALLVANHVSWIDGFILSAACPRRMRFLVNADYVNLPIVRQLAWRAGLIPVPATGPRAQRAALLAARAALDRGALVGIFPEGQLSRTGLPGTFRRGMEAIVHDRDDIPVIPAYLDNLWGSIFSHAGGRFFGHWPRGLRRTVGVAFGPPVAPPVTAASARQAVVEAGVAAFALRPEADRGRLPEPLDFSLPTWVHPEFGRLTASAPDFDQDGITQVGQKPGTVGQALPGVAIRAVDDRGEPVPVEAVGRLQALVAGRDGWIDLGRAGRIDRDGFIRFAEDGDGSHRPDR